MEEVCLFTGPYEYCGYNCKIHLAIRGNWLALDIDAKFGNVKSGRRAEIAIEALQQGIYAFPSLVDRFLEEMLGEIEDDKPLGDERK